METMHQPVIYGALQDPERGLESKVVTSGPLSEDATNDILGAVTEVSEANFDWGKHYAYTDVEELMEAFIAEKLVVVGENQRSVINTTRLYYQFEDWCEGRKDGQTARLLSSNWFPGCSSNFRPKNRFTFFLSRSLGDQIKTQNGGPFGGVCFCGLDYRI